MTMEKMLCKKKRLFLFKTTVCKERFVFLNGIFFKEGLLEKKTLQIATFLSKKTYFEVMYFTHDICFFKIPFQRTSALKKIN